MIPFMLLGDGPQEATGLGRIARDLGALLTESNLPIDFVQVGGSVPPVWTHWRHYPLDRGEDWGAGCTVALWQSIFGSEPGILFMVWDPGRLAAYRGLPLPVQKWVYAAVDSTNPSGTLGGPARAAIEEFDQVLAYGRWGSQVLHTIRPKVSYLPHGLSLDTYRTPPTEEEARWVRAELGPYLMAGHTLVGCVATNQPRKDLGLYFATLATLIKRGIPVYGWLHTDILVKSWAVQQLVEDFGLSRRITVTLKQYTDRQLALLYQACDVTIAPGLGEGFGYPIVESLAAGTPVLHGDFGGGVELVPKLEWRFPVRALRLESVYTLRRPVFDCEDVANAALRALSWREAVGREVARAYCQGAVAHLDWTQLWPRWEGWISKRLAAQ
jgi:glycosyltransferase involved in cell wall biosynthesis